MSNIPTITYHPEYTLMQEEVKNVRTAILGSPFVKAEREALLPHPSSIDTSSPEAKMRYQTYIAGAEFDEFPKQTLKTILGRMKFNSLSVELPDKISYLTENIDNDGTSLVGAIENAAASIAPLKWHCLVTDYRGLSGLALDEVSKADVAAIKPRASIKQYPRESVIWWNYDRIDDAMQLTFIMLREVTLDFNKQTFLGTSVESFLILALDENGDYYQQKIVRNVGGAGYIMGEPDYVRVGKQPLKWLPVEIVADEELTPGKLPMDLGMLAPICDLALARYRVSARYKECMDWLSPTVNIKGADKLAWDQFIAINKREYIITGVGGVNILCDNMEMEVVSVGVNTEPFERYFKDNEAKVRALGGSFPTDQGKEQTATEANIGNAEQTARLVTMAYQLEAGFKRAILYAGMFEGLWSPDDIESNIDQIELMLNKDFAQAKMSPQDRDAIRNDYLAQLIGKEEALKQLEQGGVLISDAETLLAMDDGADANSLTLD
ncbi:hypothetical protein ORI99_00095 [Alishewanella sp. SMS9]|nr:hypothetical protein [Alishewanella sp. SMS9]